MEQTRENSVKRVKQALEELHKASNELLDAWWTLDDEAQDKNEEAQKFWNILTDTYKESPFSEIKDSYEVVPTMMQNWIEAIEKREEEA
jgi:hypothetical protein